MDGAPSFVGKPTIKTCVAVSGIFTGMEIKMRDKIRSTHTQPGAFIEDDGKADDGVVNDSLGTVDPADSTGVDEEKETGDAKKGNEETRED
jgi:hypothetical protein